VRVDAELAERERREASAMLAADVEELQRLWADDFVVTPPDLAPRDKATVLAGVLDGAIAYTSFERIVDQERALGADVVVTVGREIVTPAPGGPGAGTRLLRRFTHVWQRRGDGWQLVARHVVVTGPADE